MGPVIFITGNHQQRAGAAALDLASMGPVIFITGNTGVDPANLLILALQWGR